MRSTKPKKPSQVDNEIVDEASERGHSREARPGSASRIDPGQHKKERSNNSPPNQIDSSRIVNFHARSPVPTTIPKQEFKNCLALAFVVEIDSQSPILMVRPYGAPHGIELFLPEPD